MTRETVEIETPECSAISSRVIFDDSFSISHSNLKPELLSSLFVCWYHATVRHSVFSACSYYARHNNLATGKTQGKFQQIWQKYGKLFSFAGKTIIKYCILLI